MRRWTVTLTRPARSPARPRFDVITAFDAVHDQRSPQDVLHRVRAALAPGASS